MSPTDQQPASQPPPREPIQPALATSDSTTDSPAAHALPSKRKPISGSKITIIVLLLLCGPVLAIWGGLVLQGMASCNSFINTVENNIGLSPSYQILVREYLNCGDNLAGSPNRVRYTLKGKDHHADLAALKSNLKQHFEQLNWVVSDGDKKDELKVTLKDTGLTGTVEIYSIQPEIVYFAFEAPINEKLNGSWLSSGKEIHSNGKQTADAIGLQPYMPKHIPKKYKESGLEEYPAFSMNTDNISIQSEYVKGSYGGYAKNGDLLISINEWLAKHDEPANLCPVNDLGEQYDCRVFGQLGSGNIMVYSSHYDDHYSTRIKNTVIRIGILKDTATTDEIMTLFNSLEPYDTSRISSSKIWCFL